jgi:Tol biopolymer transport system component
MIWSPEGDAAVFTEFPEDRLYRRRSATAKEEPLTVSGTNTYATSWSPDGRFLLFSQTGDTTLDDLWMLPIGERSGTPTIFRQTPFAEAAGQFSPDGKWIAFHSDASRRFEVYIASTIPGGGEWQVSTDGGLNPRWRSDGRGLYYLTSDKTMMAVDVTAGPPFAIGTPRALFRERRLITNNRETSFAPATDGHGFLAVLTTGDDTASPITVVTDWQAAYAR